MKEFAVDSLDRYMLAGTSVRAELASLDAGWAEVIARHSEQSNVLQKLGELSVAGILLAGTVKFDGSVILQIHGDGPIALMVTECDAAGAFRSTVKMRDGANVDPGASLTKLVNQSGRGRFALTLQPPAGGAGAPYQGIVELGGATIARVLDRYMHRSEQIATRMWLAADQQRAVGLLLQQMPAEGAQAQMRHDEDAWPRMQMLADTLSPAELLSSRPAELIHRLFWQESPAPIDSKALRFSCRCNRGKVARMLKMLGRDEIQALVDERGEVEVRCDFCNSPYRFDAVDALAVFADSLVPGVRTRQ